MATYDAGDASINIRPSLKGFVAELEADLKKIDAQLGVAVHPNLAQAQADLARWRAQEERNSIDIPVNVDTNSVSRATRELNSLAGAGGKALSALKWNAGALGIGSLPAMGTALAAVAGSLQQVSQAGLVMPGVFAGVLSSAGTAKLAVSGVSDAFKAVVESSDGSAASIEKANAAMAQLAPNARAFVTALAGLKPEFDDLQGTVQNNFFAGLDDSIKDLTGKQLPTLKAGLGGISTALNQNLRQLAASAGSESSQGLLGRILGNTGDAQSRLTKAIDPLVHALGTLTAAGSDTLPTMADGVGALADRFNQFITTADADGRLDKWIDDGIKGVEHLGSIVLDLGKTFAGITKAAGGGEGLLAMLDQGAAKLSAFVNSAGGQEKLTRFFNEGKQQLSQWLPILQNLVPIFGSIYEASKQWTDALLPPLQAITGVLADHPHLIQAVAEMFLAWKTIDGITSLLGSLGTVKTMLGVDLPGAANTGASGISAALARVAVPAWLTWLMYKTDDSINQELEKRGLPVAPTDRSRSGNAALPVLPGDPLGINEKPPAIPKGGPFGTGNGPHGRGPVKDPTGGALPTDAGPQQPAAPPQDPYTLIPGYQGPKRAGGPTPAGRGPGPTGGWLAEVHGDEWVLPAHARAAVGDQALWALTKGRKFDQGGYIDPYGNPVTPGAAPGPGAAAPSIAPNPYQGGGIAGIFGPLVSGLQGPIALGASLANLGSQAGAEGAIPGLQTQHGAGTILPGGAAPLSLADRAAGIPGLWGLVGSMASSDPGKNLMAWGEQTGQWLGNFTARTVGSFATSLWKGALGIFGLENSILSPDNPWNLAGQSVGQFAFGSDGPLGKLLGANPGAGAADSDSRKTMDPKKIREAQDKVSDKDAAVAEQKQRLAELPANASESTRTTRQNALAKAEREAAQARSDLTTLFSGATQSAGAYQTGMSAPAGTGVERWRPAVRQALATYGPQFGITNVSAWEDAMVRQLATESGGDPGAYNGNDSNGRGGRQVVQGIGQFLRSTFDANNITGGDYLDPYAQIAAMIPYVAKKYGTDSSGAPLQIGRGVGYYAGGPTPPGRSTAYPAILHGDEFVISARGRATVPDSFLHALNQGAVDPGSLPQFLNGGDPAMALLRNPTPPRPQIPDIKPMTPRPAAGAAPAQLAPRPAPVAQGPAPAAPPAPQPGEPAQQQGAPLQSRIGGPGPGSAPSQLNHNLPWIDTAIDSTASTLGNIAATAMSMGAAGGTAGMGGGAGGALASSMVAGLFQQVGKIGKNVVNVFSSALVGNLGDNTTSGAYGAPLLSAPPQPARSIDARTMFGDVSANDPRDFVEKQRLYEQQRSQTMVDYV
ncbi:hypothetical protein A5699_02075 [Mycobacterium sp. E802]|uniref:hypothetical protein n=1 Tax=Mycobacterium sp. E802 TaxID=1834152 RepID=UPI0007FBD89C|nr:hypothetical protein [Mycobacterium sp. E802]OBG87536.1 hypothetical protein A5699_02075 [Mycobacterium sp. E802]